MRNCGYDGWSMEFYGSKSELISHLKTCYSKSELKRALDREDILISKEIPSDKIIEDVFE